MCMYVGVFLEKLCACRCIIWRYSCRGIFWRAFVLVEETFSGDVYNTCRGIFLEKL